MLGNALKMNVEEKQKSYHELGSSVKASLQWKLPNYRGARDVSVVSKEVSRTELTDR